MRKINYVIMFVILAVVISGCTIQNNNSSKIKIGVSETLSGNYANIGNNILEGINEGIGENNNIELIVFDNQGESKKAIDDYQFSKISNIKIFVTAFSHISESVNPLSKEDKNILLYNAMTPELAESNEYSFRIYADAEIEANSIIDLIKNYNNTVAFLYVNNPSTEIFLTQIDKASLTIEKYSFEKTETDYRTIIQKLKQKDIKNIIIVAYPNNIIQFIKQSEELDYIPKRIIANSDGSDETVLKEIRNSDETNYITLAYGTDNIYYTFGKYLGKILLLGIRECESRGYNGDDPECLKLAMPDIIIDERAYINEKGVMQIEPQFYKIWNHNLVQI